jgi:surface protein
MGSMFQGASRFNSDISKWDVSSITDMLGMFEGASIFNQNLCPWGSKLSSSYYLYLNKVYNMFTLAGCANKNSPLGRTGPWCAVTTCNA